MATGARGRLFGPLSRAQATAHGSLLSLQPVAARTREPFRSMFRTPRAPT